MMQESACYGIIPARYDSTRLPGKPLADIHGKPMFWHVYDRARRCARLGQVWVATDDARVMDAARQLDVPCLLTAKDHPSGTDRVREAAALIGAGEDAIIVNIQGDEPLLEPGMLDEVLSPFTGAAGGEVRAATLSMPLDPDTEEGRALIASPNQVKVVTALNGDALYFSRAPIPFVRDSDSSPCYAGHIGLYAFRGDILELFPRLPQSPLERMEKLEQLRLLENGISLRVVKSRYRPHGVDTLEDLEAVRAVMLARQ